MRKPSKSSGQRPDLLERVKKMIRVRRLFRRGQAILVAVSGGLDSTALLHVLHGLAPANGWRLSVAHLNHRLRGRSSDADERLVSSICEKLALPVYVERADVRRIAREQKISIEMAARKSRHEFLARVAAKEKISTIALAHHADDQVELFFIRLFRGSGGEGLAGMKWRNDFPGAKGIEIVRPLLGEPKSALCEFARANKVRFREDATNASLDILRNRIRHQLLPLLRRNYQPALNKVVLRLMDILAEEADLARVMAEDWIRPAGRTKYRKLNLQFPDLPVAVQRRCLQMQLLAEGISPDFELIEKLRLNPDKGVSIEQPGSSRRTVLRDSSGSVRWQTSEAIQFDSESRKLSLRDATGQTTFDGIGILWQNQHKPGLKRPKLRQHTEYFDAKLVGSEVILRHWRQGDRFQPIGMRAAVKLQDLFINQKVPRALRHQLVVATTEKGEIFWVEGLRISERFQLTKQTKRRLQWRWSRD